MGIFNFCTAKFLNIKYRGKCLFLNTGLNINIAVRCIQVVARKGKDVTYNLITGKVINSKLRAKERINVTATGYEDGKLP